MTTNEKLADLSLREFATFAPLIVLAVWIGDFRGEGNPAFVGTDAAAPLFFRIADAVNLARPDDTPAPAVPPPGVTRVEVCTDSGDLPNADCPRTIANRALGVVARRGTATHPQLLVTCLWHMGLGLLWDWRGASATFIAGAGFAALAALLVWRAGPPKRN